MRADLTALGAIAVPDFQTIAGIIDIKVVPAGDDGMLLATTRGGGWLTAFDLGNSGGDTQHVANWSISAAYSQLESLEIEFRETGTYSYEVYLAGLNSPSLRGVSVSSNSGTPFGSAVSQSVNGLDASAFVSLALWEDQSGGIAALKSGGLSLITFGAGSVMQSTAIAQSSSIPNGVAGDITLITQGNQRLAIVSYPNENTVSLFRMNSSGVMQHIDDLTAANALWVTLPERIITITDADGALYAVVASAGTSSLSVLAIDSDGGGMQVVDHIIDDLDTRFANAAHLSALTIGGQNFVLAAGSDAGLSLFIVLPGGRLQHVQTVAGSIASPLHGITDIEVVETSQGARVFVSTQSSPFIAEFVITLENAGITQTGSSGGETLTGTSGDDVQNGLAGNDVLQGGAGDDILIGGAGQDSLYGGSGSDLFIITGEEADDIIYDFSAGEDQIDVSGIGVGVSGVTVLSRSWGAELHIGDAIIQVRTDDGSRLYTDDFGPETLISDGRPSIDLSDYPDPAPPGLNHGPTQQAGAKPNAPIWKVAPSASLNNAGQGTQGSSASDVLNGGGGNDVIFGNVGKDTISANAGNDSISGGDGNDLIYGNDQDDLLVGNDGFDTIHGGDGADTLAGENHADSLFGGAGDDIIIGNGGFDQLYGNDGNDSLWAGSEPDRLFGGEGDDWLSSGSNVGITVDGVFGEAGNDTLFGRGGFDLLTGGSGNDLMDGGD